MLRRGFRRQHIATLRRHALENLCYLRRRFTLAKNYLRHARAHAAMVVNLGKAQIFKRHVPHAGHRVIGCDRAFADFLEQFSEARGIHLRIQINTKEDFTAETRKKHFTATGAKGAKETGEKSARKSPSAVTECF
jgi:hypothetical protein